MKDSSSAPSSFASRVLAPAVFLSIGALLLIDSLVPSLAPRAAPASTKPFATFSHFYPHYLSEHSLPWTKRLHLVGTLAMAAQVVRTPGLGLAAGAAGGLGFLLFPHLRWLATGLPEFALMMLAYFAVGMRATGDRAQAVLALPAVSYLFAWLGHALVERNRPATFVYPVFSLMGDLRMAAEMLTGALPV